MARAFKCDICGKLFEPYDVKRDSSDPDDMKNKFTFIRLGRYAEINPPSFMALEEAAHIELCKWCRDDIKRILLRKYISFEQPSCVDRSRET